MNKPAPKPLWQLAALVTRGLQPARREVWLGLGFLPPKRCAIALDPARLPNAADCAAVVGLDVILSYHGNAVRYGQLRTLCNDLARAGPRRLLLVDLDVKKIAFLKLEAA